LSNKMHSAFLKGEQELTQQHQQAAIAAEARATKAEAENARLCKLIDAVQEEYWLRTGNADLDDLMNDLRRAREAQG